MKSAPRQGMPGALGGLLIDRSIREAERRQSKAVVVGAIRQLVIPAPAAGVVQFDLEEQRVQVVVGHVHRERQRPVGVVSVIARLDATGATRYLAKAVAAV